MWFGGEGAYARRSTVVTNPLVAEDPDDTGITNGWSVGGLVGTPVYRGRAGDLHLYAFSGVRKFGGSGPNIRFGFEFRPIP